MDADPKVVRELAASIAWTPIASARRYATDRHPAVPGASAHAWDELQQRREAGRARPLLSGKRA